ncbi:hypothetical protein [Rhodopseudomonas palustris]|uniref:hypothetical protein n=1 Tax=Rhodopseudomonas palustris TaxID=1076 RepID=UPI000D22ADD0|nr:hypothetical protein [Rhodopseudomonas palustris]AVT83690.1 hypothetical protein RPYSC3_48300 [Rhodopseudomonas palustris]
MNPVTVNLPLYLTWTQLKKLGWPLSRTQTYRLMDDPAYAKVAFPECKKLGTHRNSRPVWYTPSVLEYFKTRGLPIPENVTFF